MKMLLALLALAGACLSSPGRAETISEDEAYAIGIETYIYAYPLVLMEMTRRVGTNVAQPDNRHAPMNRFAHMRRYPDASFRDVVRPNADTLYSLLWYDVSKEPLIITLPDTGGRYHVIPIMDMWTDVFATLGSRTTGTKGGPFALVSPNWRGSLPKNMRKIVSPTDIGWIIGRIQTNGAADYPQVHAMQARFATAPLSAWGKKSPPVRITPVTDSSPATDSKAPPVDQVAALPPAEFFHLFADLMKRNPPHASDVAMRLRMEKIGILPGHDFDLAQIDPAIRRSLERAATDAQQRIVARRRDMRLTPNGWVALGSAVGVYGNDYLQRAFVAYLGLGALPPEEAIYPMAPVDGQGKPLTGSARYVLHFDKDKLPPADAFWSLTMYGADQFFVANPINRFAIGDRDKLTYNADGSLDIYIQNASPGADRESNWLPAPAGPFTMNLRLYLPQPQAREGRWNPPAVQRQAEP